MQQTTHSLTLYLCCNSRSDAMPRYILYGTYFSYVMQYTVNGTWSDWSSWTNCSCITNSWFRSRECDNPAPLNGGENCEGHANETDPCEPTACPGSLFHF